MTSEPTKTCPRCGEPLLEKKCDGKRGLKGKHTPPPVRYCRNGCSIWTAAPTGVAYRDPTGELLVRCTPTDKE